MKMYRVLRCKTPHMGRVAEKQTHVKWRLQDAETRKKIFKALKVRTSSPHFMQIAMLLHRVYGAKHGI